MYYLVKVIKSAEPLDSADFCSETDACVLINCNGNERITTVKENTNNPVWNEIFLFEGRSTHITISIIDRNKWSSDKTLKKEILNICDDGSLEKTVCCGIEIEHGYVKIHTAKIHMESVEKLGLLTANIGDLIFDMKDNISNLV